MECKRERELSVIPEEKGGDRMRKPIVSRTIQTTKVIAAVKGAEGIESCLLMIAGTWKDEKELLHKCRVANEGIEIIGIISSETRKVLYGMSEQAFIENADVLDIKTRKPI